MSMLIIEISTNLLLSMKITANTTRIANTGIPIPNPIPVPELPLPPDATKS